MEKRRYQLSAAGALLLALVVIVLVWPWLIIGPAVVVGAWIAVATIVRAFRIRRLSAPMTAEGQRTHDERTRGL